MKKILCLLAIFLSMATTMKAGTPILGKPVASTDRMYQFVMSKSPGWSFSREIAEAFHDIGTQWGVRGDIAICQSCWETGWFRYSGGTAVTPDDHNYCGLGVTTLGYKGCQFSSIREGVTAQLQHLWSYATTADLPAGWTKVDPRFAHGRRGWAPNWEDLGSGNWASAAGYGTKIMGTYNEMMSFAMANPKLTASTTDITITAQQNATSPTQNVTITGENLSSDIKIVTNSSTIKYSTSNWNATTGGTLVVSIDTSKAPGTYTGGYIRVYSGDQSVTINVTPVITGTPSISVNPTSLSFEVTQGDANPTANVSVTGTYLDRDMVYVSNSSMFTVTPASNWNARTGGTLTVSVDASKAPGTYTGYIAVQTTTSVRQTVNITAVVKAAVSPDPSLTSNSSSISLSGKVGESGPTTSVYITGQNLTQDISYSSSSAAFTISPAGNWNARTGGTLNITLNTAVGAGTHNGVITVTSSGQKIEIPAVATISGSGVTPQAVITASPTSLNFTAAQGDARPYSYLSVSAANLSADMTITSANPALIVADIDEWNARTGGRLLVTLDTSKDPGTYTGNITIKSGNASATVTTNATISEKGGTAVIPPLDFQEMWNKGQTSGDASIFTKVRNFDHADGKLYCVYNANEIKIVDARTGVEMGSLDNGNVVAGGAVALCDVKCLNGKIYACNITTNPSVSPVRVYVWDNDQAPARLLFESNDAQGAPRLGDCMDIVGTDDDLWVAFANDDNTTVRIVEYNLKGGNITAKHTVATTDGSKSLATGVSTRVRPTGNGYFIDGKGILPSFLDLSGKVQYQFKGESNTHGNDFGTFSYDGREYMLIASYLNQSSTNYADGIMRLYDITDGWDAGVAKGEYPANGLGTTPNTATAGALRVNPCGDCCVEAWVLAYGQGMAYYRSGTIGGCTPDPGPGDEPTEVALPSIFNEDWSFCTVKGTSASYINPADAMTRNMMLKGDNLYIVQRRANDCAVHIVNAQTGEHTGAELPTTGITVNNWSFSSVAKLGDAIVACNLAFSATTVLNVYGWTSDTATPQLVLQTTNHGGRSGDLMCASGTWEKGKLYFTTNSAFDGYAGRLYVYNVTNGKADATPEIVTLRKADGSAYDLGATFAVIEIRVLEDGTIQASGSGGTTAWFNADGSFIRQLGAGATNGNILGSSAHVFDYGKYKLAAVTTYEGANWVGGYTTLANVTDHENPSVVKNFDVLGTAKNSAAVTTAIAKVDESKKIHIWTLIPNQGIAKYTATSQSTAADEEIARKASFRLDGHTLSVQGAEASSIQVLSVAGTTVAHSRNNEVDLGGLTRGIYIAVATTTDGERLTLKIALK